MAAEKRVVPWVGVIIGAVLLLWALLAFVSTILFIGGSSVADGRIVILQGRPVVAYSDADGQSHVAPVKSIFRMLLNGGDSYRVLYRPNDYERADLNSPLFLFTIPSFLALIGLLTLVAFGQKLMPARD